MDLKAWKAQQEKTGKVAEKARIAVRVAIERQQVRQARSKARPVRYTIKFSGTWYGELWKRGYASIWRHCNRYGKKMIYEDMREAIGDSMVVLVESKGEILQGDKIPAYLWARVVVNAYKRVRRASCFYHKEFNVIGLETTQNERDYSYLPANRYAADIGDLISYEDKRRLLQEKLSPEVYAAGIAFLQGYSHKEIAKTLRKGVKTVYRYRYQFAEAIRDYDLE